MKLAGSEKDQAYTALFDLVFNISLFGLALVLAMWSFFALQEILLTLGAYAILHAVDDSVRGNYTLITLRNFWLLGAGAFMVGFIIFCLDYIFKHWRRRRARRLFLRILVVEVCIIGLSVLVAG